MVATGKKMTGKFLNEEGREEMEQAALDRILRRRW